MLLACLLTVLYTLAYARNPWLISFSVRTRAMIKLKLYFNFWTVVRFSRFRFDKIWLRYVKKSVFRMWNYTFALISSVPSGQSNMDMFLFQFHQNFKWFSHAIFDWAVFFPSSLFLFNSLSNRLKPHLITCNMNMYRVTRSVYSTIFRSNQILFACRPLCRLKDTWTFRSKREKGRELWRHTVNMRLLIYNHRSIKYDSQQQRLKMCQSHSSHKSKRHTPNTYLFMLMMIGHLSWWFNRYLQTKVKYKDQR